MNMGLTGGIATGKSSVAKLLVNKGAILIDADQIAREVVLPGSPVLTEISKQFGQAVILPDGSLNRPKLGEMIFANPTLREVLNGIIHPPIRELLMERKLEAELRFPDQLVVLDIPLLYESGYDQLLEEVMVVYVPQSIQIERLMLRDKLTLEQAELRLKAQWPIESKRERADIVIDNSGTWEATQEQIDRLWERKGL